MSRRTTTATVTASPSSERSPTRISIVPSPVASSPRAAASPHAPAPSWDPSSPVSPWLPAALGIAARDVSPCRASIPRVVQNLAAGADALLAERDEIDRAGVAVDWARVAASSSLGVALSLVAARVDASEPTLADARRALVPSRRLLSSDATTLSLKKVFPAAEVRRLLRDGTDAGRAHAVVGLADLYRTHAETIAGRTTVTADDLATATADAETLLAWVGRGKRVRGATSVDARARRDLRDRFWTLARQHHAMLCRVGGAYWGRDVARHIPGLQSARVVRHVAVAAQPTEPAKPVVG